MSMVDVHCHVIPNIDDGVRSLDEAAELASNEAEGANHVFIATPHVNNELDLRRSPQIPERVTALNEEFARRGIVANVVPGAEVYPALTMLRGLDEGLPITLAGTGRYMLLDTPRGQFPLDFESLLFELLARGVTPVLAHPERSVLIQEDPTRAEAFVAKGVALQLNSGSFLGRYGPPAVECVKHLFDRRLAHFLASDAHRPSTRTLRKVIDSLQTGEDAEYLRLLTQTSGECVLAGNPLPSLPEARPAPPKRSFWGRLFGR